MSHRVIAERLTEPWLWVTPRGDQIDASEGDFRILDAENGASWSITPEAFAAGYRHVTGEMYESRGTVQAQQLAPDSPPVTVMTLEGIERALPGDWIVSDDDGNDWVVDAMFFDANYRHVDEA